MKTKDIKVGVDYDILEHDTVVMVNVVKIDTAGVHYRILQGKDYNKIRRQKRNNFLFSIEQAEKELNLSEAYYSNQKQHELF